MLDLTSFRVSPVTGFLPSALPITRLPHQKYQPWEHVMENLPALLLSRKVRKVIDKLPHLSTDELSLVEEVRRAYQVLGFMAHAYVWGTDTPTSHIPAQIADPLIDTANQLGLPPLGTYAGLCLWNFKEIIPSGESLLEKGNFNWDNLTTINTFTGSIDESWFYLVSVFFEFSGGECVRLGTEAMDQAENGELNKLTATLQKLAESIDHLGSVLMRMEEMCDPHVFYFRIRPYLAGWKNMEAVGLDKNGVLYGEDPQRKTYAGGSNAQSSLIQFLDALLSVHHHSTGERPPPHAGQPVLPKEENSFLLDMRGYMPREHREFVQEVDKKTQIRDVVLQNNQHLEATLAYDACLAMLKLFRDKHIQIVTRYVVLQAKKVPHMGSSSTLRSGLARSKKSGAEEKGTGGTSLLPFLKQCRDETGDPAAGSWGKRLLSDGVMRLGYSKPNAVNEDEEVPRKKTKFEGLW